MWEMWWAHTRCCWPGSYQHWHCFIECLVGLLNVWCREKRWKLSFLKNKNVWVWTGDSGSALNPGSPEDIQESNRTPPFIAFFLKSELHVHRRGSGRACTCLGWAKHLPEPPQVCTPVILDSMRNPICCKQHVQSLEVGGRALELGAFGAKKSGVKHFICAKIGMHSLLAPWQGLIFPWWWIIWHFGLAQTCECSSVCSATAVETLWLSPAWLNLCFSN